MYKRMLFFKIETENIDYDGKILAIQVKKRNYLKIWSIWDYSNDEEKLLKNFVSWFLEETDKIIVGFNILKFDIPLLLLKAKKLESFRDFSQKINRTNIVDLFVILTFLRRGKLKSLDYYCEKYDIKRNLVLRDDILNLYKKKQYHEVEDAFKKNLETLEELFKSVLKEELMR